MDMQGFVAGPVNLKIDDKWYQENVYIAPIEQDMLIFDSNFPKGGHSATQTELKV